MVSMVVGHDHMGDRLRRDLANRLNQLLCQSWRTQRINHHNTLGSDDEGGIGNEILVSG